MSFYITGDTHCKFDRFNFNKYTKDDWMIILGDHMFLYFVEWDEQENKYFLSEQGKHLLNLVSQLPLNFFCINGTREAPACLVKDLVEIEVFEGRALAFPEVKNVIFAIDGEVYQFGNKKALVLGGAFPPDKSVRTSAHEKTINPRYFPESDNFLNKEITNKYEEVDMILSHTCPIDYRPYKYYLNNFIPSESVSNEENFQKFIDKSINIKDIFCGYYHVDDEEKFGNLTQHYLYKNIIKIGED